MRIGIITESFLPDLNGVAHSVARTAEHLVAQGHDPLVIAAQPASGARKVTGPLPYPVVRVASLPTPGYASFRLGLPSRRIAAALREHGTEVVHLASPFVLGAHGVSVARELDVPMVAVYQTDVAAYARARHLRIGEAAIWRWLRRIHNAADRTLAPSSATAASLHQHGVERVWLWRRGVDAVRFHPAHRSDELRAALAPHGEVIVGYVGRLATEKRVDLLEPVTRMPGVRVVIVGDGPATGKLKRALPRATFLGARSGHQLARLYASLDVFAHTGPYETFGQTVQEALASGVPVVAPAAGGPLDLVDHGATGYLVPPDDAASLADAVASLVASSARRAEFGRAARVRVAGRTWAAIGDELIEHYRAVVHPGVTAPVPVPVG